ncbi:hypothetical protein PG985_011209 [Apiospora marii]|uniref:Uncharacterized protein n=1 Tax=Apiospora marii TaxID=335849 RepID=A0ABR1ST07_9PEZI
MLDLEVRVVVHERLMAGLQLGESLITGLVAEPLLVLVLALHGRGMVLLLLEGRLLVGGIETVQAQLLPVPIDTVGELGSVIPEALDLALECGLLIDVLAALVNLALAVVAQNGAVGNVAVEQRVKLLLERVGSGLLKQDTGCDVNGVLARSQPVDEGN